MEDRTCFVIIGYGKKTSYINGKVRELDLDQTYTILIKPVFDELGMPCYRAIDKNTSGSIDKLMLQEIKNAYMVVTDISTLNANVMWELGVRHALKPHHTIMICEKAQMSAIPFDVNSFVIHQYTHSEEGIPYTEVDRFRRYLKETVQKIIQQDPPQNDSPVFTFLENELLQPFARMESLDSNEDKRSFAEVMNDAEAAKKAKQHDEALKHLTVARKMAESNMTLKDNLSLIISRQALNTYKSKSQPELEALIKGRLILDELNPATSTDIEVLGLSGAINKRLFELTADTRYLDSSIQSYEKGFQLKQDYYNGINAAFMLYKKACLMKTNNDEWDDVKLKADYIRNGALEAARQQEATELNGNSWENYLATTDKADSVWILYTIAEAYNYKGNAAKQQEYEDKAAQLAQKFNDSFAPASYAEQKGKIKLLMDCLR